MATSEIDKLERRFAENPHGLTFAPLAEIYRKNDDVARALELLGPGLERHPEYIPARIVLGRCHFDLGDLAEAEQAFTSVLALDGENVIALKALADISERLLRYDDAERWLHTLLSVDRNNATAQEQLARLEVARRQAELGTAGVPDAAPAESMPEPVVSIAVPEVVAIAPVVEPVAEVVAWVSDDDADVDAATEAPAEAAPLVLDDLTPPDEPIPPAEDVELELEEPEAVPSGPVGSLAGLVTPDSPTLRDELADVGDHFRIETADEVVLRPSGASEFQMPDASQELVAAGPEPDPLAPSRAAVAAPVVDEPAPVALAPAAVEPTLIVTETMAEVLLHQGYTADALRIYRELERRSQGERRLADKIAELEAHGAEGAKQTPAYAARDTGGQSVGTFFRDLLAARLAEAPAAAPLGPASVSAPGVGASSGSAGAPTRPAADTLSLSAVFGEETSPVPPAVSAGSKSDPSFDEFFGAPSAGRMAKVARTPDPKEDDLDQFHSWLQNLKR